ncbi:MAG: GNAT family N-acetyltransferase [Pseudomonadales bacterium]
MSALEVRPLTPALWADFERLFSPNGAWGGCWCMYLRLPGREFEPGCRGGGAANREAFRAVVDSGAEPGLLACRDGEAVGWVAVAPREAYGRVLRSPIHKPVDDVTGVWSVSCFFVAKGERGQGVADALLVEAIRFATSKGATVVEAYPIDTDSASRPAGEVWRGTLAQFERAGFEVVARRKPGRPIVRLLSPESAVE